MDHIRSLRAFIYNFLTLHRGYITAERFSLVFSLMSLIRFLPGRDFLSYNNKDSLTEFLVKIFLVGNTYRLFSPPNVACFYCMLSNTVKEMSLTNSVTISLHYDFSDAEVRLNDH